jgi:hypothetical protein
MVEQGKPKWYAPDKAKVKWQKKRTQSSRFLLPSLSLSLEGSVLLWSFLRQKTMGGRRRVITSPRSLASPSIKRVNNNTRPVHSYDPSLAFLLSYHDASFFWGKKNLSTEHH